MLKGREQEDAPVEICTHPQSHKSLLILNELFPLGNVGWFLKSMPWLVNSKRWNRVGGNLEQIPPKDSVLQAAGPLPWEEIPHACRACR